MYSILITMVIYSILELIEEGVDACAGKHRASVVPPDLALTRVHHPVSMQHIKSGNRRGKRAVGAISRGSGNNDNKSRGGQDKRAGGVPASNRSTDGSTRARGRRAPGTRATVCIGKSDGQRPVDTAVSGRQKSQNQAQCGVDTHQA